MLTILIAALLIFQPPHKAIEAPKPDAPPPPAATQPAKPPSAIDQLSMPQRRIINERAKDFYLIPDAATGGFTYADAYRLHRIRELLTKGTGKEPWKKISATDAAKLGMGHLDNEDQASATRFGHSAPITDHRSKRRPEYKDLPDLVTVPAKNAIIICDHPHLGTEPLPPNTIHGAATPEIQTSPRCLTTIPHKVTIKQIIEPNVALVTISYFKNSNPPGDLPKDGFAIHGPTTGMHDGQLYPGDFILLPREAAGGTENYKNFAGVRATVASYDLIPLDKPVTPEDLAQAILDGKATINTYTIISKPGGYEWKSAPIKFIFKP